MRRGRSQTLIDHKFADPVDGPLAHDDAGSSELDPGQGRQDLEGGEGRAQLPLPRHHQAVADQRRRLAKQRLRRTCDEQVAA